MKSILSFRNSPVTRARRAGRMPLPRRTELSYAAPENVERVKVFTDMLCDLPLADWLAVGLAVVADQPGATSRAAALGRREAAIEARRLCVAAWEVRDAIDTAAYLATQGVSGWTRENRRAFAAAHAAAEDAALALLAGDALSLDDRRALAGPFNALSPPPAPGRSQPHSA